MDREGFFCLHKKEIILTMLERNPYLFSYHLGDLDDLLWPFTTWYGWGTPERLQAVILVYAGYETPTVAALCLDPAPMEKLLNRILPLLPVRFFAHLTPGVESLFEDQFQMEWGYPHFKMALTDAVPINKISDEGVRFLTEEELPALLQFYEEAYPGNWFDPYMLQTGRYCGIQEGDRLIAVAGVHVYSPEYRIAALGNIATHPDVRNRGLGTRVTAALCRKLHAEGLRIGLNVKQDNHPALACYRSLGFEVAAEYVEFLFRRRG